MRLEKCIFLLFLLLKWNPHNPKLTILKRIIQLHIHVYNHHLHLVPKHCAVGVSTVFCAKPWQEAEGTPFLSSSTPRPRGQDETQTGASSAPGDGTRQRRVQGPEPLGDQSLPGKSLHGSEAGHVSLDLWGLERGNSHGWEGKENIFQADRTARNWCLGQHGALGHSHCTMHETQDDKVPNRGQKMKPSGERAPKELENFARHTVKATEPAGCPGWLAIVSASSGFSEACEGERGTWRRGLPRGHRWQSWLAPSMTESRGGDRKRAFKKHIRGKIWRTRRSIRCDCWERDVKNGAQASGLIDWADACPSGEILEFGGGRQAVGQQIEVAVKLSRSCRWAAPGVNAEPVTAQKANTQPRGVARWGLNGNV